MTPEELLTTTRTVRKRLDLDRPVELPVLRECIEIALQAPSQSNSQPWHFVVVLDEGQRREIGAIYKKCFEVYRKVPQSAYALAAAREGVERERMERVADSAEYLAENMHRVPAIVIPCFAGRVDSLTPPIANVAQAGFFASILPATWSFILAAHLRGLGSALTTMHLLRERETADVLGIPYQEITQTCLLPVGYIKGGGFRPAPRGSVDSVIHVDDW